MIHTIVTYDPSGAVADTITLDCVKSFSESYTATVTTNPVESGTVISDDIIHEQETFSMSGIISDYAFRRAGFRVIFQNGEFVRESVVDDSRDELPTIYVKDRLRSIIQDGEVFSVIKSIGKDVLGTTLENHFPCVATNLTVSDIEDGAIEVNITIKKIKVATVIFKQIDKTTRRLVPFVKPETKDVDAKDGSTTKDKTIGDKTAKDQKKKPFIVDPAQVAFIENKKLQTDSFMIQAQLNRDPIYVKDDAKYREEYFRRMKEQFKYTKEQAQVYLWIK